MSTARTRKTACNSPSEPKACLQYGAIRAWQVRFPPWRMNRTGWMAKSRQAKRGRRFRHDGTAESAHRAYRRFCRGNHDRGPDDGQAGQTGDVVRRAAGDVVDCADGTSKLRRPKEDATKSGLVTRSASQLCPTVRLDSGNESVIAFAIR